MYKSNMHETMTKKEWLKMYELVNAAQEVYNTLGRGMQEPIYQEAMAIELSQRGIPFEREVELCTWYKGVKLNKKYVADFMSEDVIIEFKSVTEITSDHRAQLFNYMRITDIKKGILVNYGENSFHSERYVYDPTDDRYQLITKTNLHLYVED